MKFEDFFPKRIEEREAMLKEQIRLEFRSMDAWAEQLINLFLGYAALLGSSVLVTAAFVSAVAMFAFGTIDLAAYPAPELRQAFEPVVIACGTITLICLLLGNVGKFRNVFLHRASYRVDSGLSVKEREQSQTDTTERLLVQYGLISNEDVARRRSAMSTEEKPSAFERVMSANANGGRASGRL